MEKVFNWFSIIFGAVGGFLVSVLGGFDSWLIALTAFIALDYITGLAKGYVTKTLSSKIGFKGLLKKMLIFVVVVISVILQKLLNNALPLRDITICFYLANEGLSLLENIAEFIPLPAKLKEVLLQVREKNQAEKKEVK